MNNSIFKKIYRIAVVVIGLIATVCTVTDHVTAFGGSGTPTALFFTSWSVWFATIAAILACYMTLKDVDEFGKSGRIINLIKFCANIMIIATFIVAGFVLPAKLWTAAYWSMGGAFKHFLLPVVTVLDSILFNPRGIMKAYDAFVATIAPLLYWIVVVTRMVSFRNSQGGAIPTELWDRYYPYGFTNFDKGHTLGGLIGLLAGILVGLILIGYCYYAVDKFSRAKKIDEEAIA